MFVLVPCGYFNYNASGGPEKAPKGIQSTEVGAKGVGGNNFHRTWLLRLLNSFFPFYLFFEKIIQYVLSYFSSPDFIQIPIHTLHTQPIKVFLNDKFCRKLLRTIYLYLHSLEAHWFLASETLGLHRKTSDPYFWFGQCLKPPPECTSLVFWVCLFLSFLSGDKVSWCSPGHLQLEIFLPRVSWVLGLQVWAAILGKLVISCCLVLSSGHEMPHSFLSLPDSTFPFLNCPISL